MPAHQLCLESIRKAAVREPGSRAHHRQFHQSGDGLCHFDSADANGLAIAYEYGQEGASFGLVLAVGVNTDGAIWSVVETCIAVVSACLLTLRPLWLDCDCGLTVPVAAP